MSEATPRRDCVVPLLRREDAPRAIRAAFDVEERRDGRVRNLTRAVASSEATWQATTRASHMYVTLKRVDPASCALLCLYTSLLNGCRYCIDDAAGAALEEDVDAGVLLALASEDLDESVLGERMVATLRYVDTLVLRPTEVPDAIVFGLPGDMDDEELLEVTTIVAMKCFWNRFASGLRIALEGRCADEELLDRLCHASDDLRRRRAVP
jgi:alkylhydroperoxidase family enzyme